ncbi:hypothetical protein B5M09_010797 [Aphanomyces astaci]|uniref:Uncharacterized protein n=1 Tax=Aphanomyces astaci TaxID=112090 RepID=A0A3R7YJY4_APHAT|nr:hypothetical protein B5M09_010797 [Aphanomyces astaci]
MEFHALLAMDGPGAKKKSKITGVVFHPVRPWVAAVESKDCGVVWNYETKEVIKRFTLQIGEDVPTAVSDDTTAVATPTAVALTKSMALSTPFSPKLSSGKAKSSSVLMFFDRESIAHVSGISRGIDCFEEWLVILSSQQIAFCDINDAQSVRCSDGKIRIWSPRLWKVCHVIDTGAIKEIPHMLLVPSSSSSTSSSPSTAAMLHCYLIAVHVDGKAIVWSITRVSSGDFQQSRACEFDLKDANKRGGGAINTTANVDVTTCGYYELKLLLQDSFLTAVSKDGNATQDLEIAAHRVDLVKDVRTLHSADEVPAATAGGPALPPFFKHDVDLRPHALAVYDVDKLTSGQPRHWIVHAFTGPLLGLVRCVMPDDGALKPSKATTMSTVSDSTSIVTGSSITTGEATTGGMHMTLEFYEWGGAEDIAGKSSVSTALHKVSHEWEHSGKYAVLVYPTKCHVIKWEGHSSKLLPLHEISTPRPVQSVLWAFGFAADALDVPGTSSHVKASICIKHMLVHTLADMLPSLVASVATDSADMMIDDIHGDLMQGTSLIQRACAALCRGGQEAAVAALLPTCMQMNKWNDALVMAMLVQDRATMAQVLASKEELSHALHTSNKNADVEAQWNQQMDAHGQIRPARFAGTWMQR